MQGGGGSGEGTEKTGQKGSTREEPTELTDGTGYMLKVTVFVCPSSNTDRQRDWVFGAPLTEEADLPSLPRRLLMPVTPRKGGSGL